METPSGAEKIKCPYCGQENQLESEFCWACYKHMRVPAEARVESRLKRELNKLGGLTAPSKPTLAGVKVVIKTGPGTELDRGPAFWGRLALVCGLFLFYLQWLRENNHQSFLDYVNLAFHEPGHLVFGFFGEFLGTLGGTISQLFFPAVCLFHFFRRGNRLGWQLCLFWLGENFLNISIYAGDAIKQDLPLVGGGVHDWTYLLTEMHLIAHTEGVAHFIFGVGTIIIFYSLYLIGSDALAGRPFGSERA